MKKILLSITAALLMMVVPTRAMDYDDISEYALFLTDKMAYELNLTEDQYEAAYEINYDYLYDMLRNGELDCYDDYDDLYGRAWSARNRDFKIILISSQYRLYRQLEYFYRPFYRRHGRIVIKIYNYYPQRDYLYFGCPDFVIKYRGGHGWRHYSRHSFYAGRAWHNNYCYGMRDGYRDGRRYYSHSTRHHSGHFDRHNDRHYDRHVSRHYDRHSDASFRDHSSRDCHNGFRNSGSRSRVSSTRTTVKNGYNVNNRSRGNVDRARRLPDNKFTPSNNRSRSNNNRSVSRTNRSENRKSQNSDSGGRRGSFGGGR